LKDLEIDESEEEQDAEQDPPSTPQPDEFKPIWRFKTEQEFIDEFGDNWKGKLGWLTGSKNMDYLYGKAVTNPTYDGAYFLPRSFDTAKELGIDSGGDNQWFLTKEMFKKIENDQPEQMDIDDLEDGKLFFKSLDNVNTFLKIDSETDILMMYTNGWQFIKPTYWSNESFIISSTQKLLDLDITITIDLIYETGINILYSNIKTQEVISIKNITKPNDFTSVIDEITEKVGRDNELSTELNYIKKRYKDWIWEGKEIKCDFVSSTPKPKFAVGDKVTKKNNKKRIFTITSITAFDDEQQQWDYDVVEDIDGNQLSYWENQLELAPIEEPSPTECNVDVSLIDSQYVGQFYQQNKNRIEALNPNISCLFLEALLSLSNYEKCGDGVEIPMPQPKKEEKEDLLSQIRNL
jgi:hypothetical protein